MDSPKTLQQAIQYFSDEQVCIDAVAMMRWPDGPRCPDCLGDKAKNPYYIKTQRRWKCRDCRRQFSVKVETIFEDSPISLQKWLPALWMLISCKNGISSYEIHRALGVSQKTAWFMLHRLRLALKPRDLGFKLGGKESGGVEVDETFVRFNNRATKDNPLNDSDRFLLALSQVAGKRLTFAELTGKEGASQF